MQTESTGDPVEGLYTFLNLILGVYPTERGAPDQVERLGAFLELRSQTINDPEFASRRQQPGRLTTGGTQNNADPRLTTGGPGDHPFFPSRSLEKDLRDPEDDAEE